MFKLSHLCLAALLITGSALAQTSKTNPRVSTVFAILTKTIELKTAKVGDELTFRTISDISNDSDVIVPNGSRLMAHLVEISSKQNGASQSELQIVIDKAISKDGGEIPLQAIIVAVAAPPGSLTSDPTYGMMHSNEPKMIGGGARSASSSGDLSAQSKASSNAAVATANMKGMDGPLLLSIDSQGATGYEGLSISWRLIAPPPVTIFASKSKNIKLDTGTQLLLRMATPRATK